MSDSSTNGTGMTSAGQATARFAIGDGFRNLVSGVGTAKDKSFHWGWSNVALTQAEIEQAYSNDWLARKIIDIIPQDMTREWRTWQTKGQDELLQAEKDFRLRSKVEQALIWARLYGGSVILIGDGAGDIATPLEPLRMRKGGLRSLNVFHRWQLNAEGEIDDDINSQTFGKPLFYRISSGTGQNNIRIHRSRFCFFYGPSTTDSMRQGEWGQSVFQSVLDTVKRLEAIAANSAALTEEAKLDVITIPDLQKHFSDQESENRLLTRFTMANQLKGMINALVVGGGETYERKAITFGGLIDLIHGNMELSSGAADIPITRLMGQSPAGLNSTGESDIRNYYDMLGAKQKTNLSEDLEPLDDVLILHALGTKPPDIAFEWEPLWALSETEKADIAQKKAAALVSYKGMGLWHDEQELRPAISDMLIDDGLLPTLDQYLMDDEDFAALAEEEAALEQENEVSLIQATTAAKQLPAPARVGDEEAVEPQTDEQQELPL